MPDASGELFSWWLIFLWLSWYRWLSIQRVTSWNPFICIYIYIYIYIIFFYLYLIFMALAQRRTVHPKIKFCHEKDISVLIDFHCLFVCTRSKREPNCLPTFYYKKYIYIYVTQKKEKGIEHWRSLHTGFAHFLNVYLRKNIYFIMIFTPI